MTGNFPAHAYLCFDGGWQQKWGGKKAGWLGMMDLLVQQMYLPSPPFYHVLDLRTEQRNIEQAHLLQYRQDRGVIYI